MIALIGLRYTGPKGIGSTKIIRPPSSPALDSFTAKYKTPDHCDGMWVCGEFQLFLRLMMNQLLSS